MSQDGNADETFQGRNETDLSDLLGYNDTLPTASEMPERKISFLEANRDLIGAGASVHWLVPRQKRPVSSDWSEIPNQTLQDLSRSYRTGQNIGIRLGRPSRIGQDYLHVMDLDIRDASKAKAARAKLLEFLPDAESLPTVVSGSGGESRHIYFLTDVAFRKTKMARSDTYRMIFDPTLGRDVKKYDWEIDLMGTGSQVVLPPSIHPTTGQSYRWERKPDLVFPFMMKISASTQKQLGARLDDPNSSSEDDDETYLETVLAAQPLDLTSGEVNEILTMLPEDWVEDRDHWLTVGAALHHQFEGKREGFDRWCEWAKQSAKFDAKDSARVWKSFKGSKNPVRMATLIQAAGWSRTTNELLRLDAKKPLAPTPFVLPEADMDSSRGASAISGAVRSARVLNAMSKDVAKQFGISDTERRSFVRVDNGKYNLAPAEEARWIKLVNVWLGNATTDRPEDGVGVVERWVPAPAGRQRPSGRQSAPRPGLPWAWPPECQAIRFAASNRFAAKARPPP